LSKRSTLILFLSNIPSTTRGATAPAYPRSIGGDRADGQRREARAGADKKKARRCRAWRALPIDGA
jgi:hypothetical protein